MTGRVVVEACREYDAKALQQMAGHGKPLIVWERVTHRLLADGTTVERREMLFPPEHGNHGRYHAYRWLVTGRLRHGMTAGDYARAYRAPEDDGTPSPWSVKVWIRGIPHTDDVPRRRQRADDRRDDRPDTALE